MFADASDGVPSWHESPRISMGGDIEEDTKAKMDKEDTEEGMDEEDTGEGMDEEEDSSATGPLESDGQERPHLLLLDLNARCTWDADN